MLLPPPQRGRGPRDPQIVRHGLRSLQTTRFPTASELSGGSRRAALAGDIARGDAQLPDAPPSRGERAVQRGRGTGAERDFAPKRRGWSELRDSSKPILLAGHRREAREDAEGRDVSLLVPFVASARCGDRRRARAARCTSRTGGRW